MVPTYATKGSRRYAYYETRKNLVKPTDKPATRWPRATLEKHIVARLSDLLDDEHALRRLANIEEAAQLAVMFEAARLRKLELAHPASRDAAIRLLIGAIQLTASEIEMMILTEPLGIASDQSWRWNIPLPNRRPFREAKLRIEGHTEGHSRDPKLIDLVVEAMKVRELVLSNPQLSINRLAKNEGRCRKQLGRLFRASWLSPRIVETILAGHQPPSLTRKRLLEIDLPIEWEAQEAVLGFTR